MNLGHASPTAHPRAVGILNRIGEFFFERAPEPPDPRLVAALEHVVDTAIAKREGVAVTQPIGASGIVSTGGYVQTSERSADLVGTTRQQKFEEWKRLLAQIGGAYRIYLVLIGSPTWSLPPWKASKDTDPTPEDEERAAWALNQLLNLGEDGLERLVMELSIAFWDGLAVGAWTAKAMPPGDLAAFGLADVLKLPLSTIERYDLDPQGRVLFANTAFGDLLQLDAPALQGRPVGQALMALGIGGLALSESDGGAGLGLLDAALVCEVVGEAAAPGPLIFNPHLVPMARGILASLALPDHALRFTMTEALPMVARAAQRPTRIATSRSGT